MQRVVCSLFCEHEQKWKKKMSLTKRNAIKLKLSQCSFQQLYPKPPKHNTDEDEYQHSALKSPQGFCWYVFLRVWGRISLKLKLVYGHRLQSLHKDCMSMALLWTLLPFHTHTNTDAQIPHFPEEYPEVRKQTLVLLPDCFLVLLSQPSLKCPRAWSLKWTVLFRVQLKEMSFSENSADFDVKSKDSSMKSLKNL